MNDKTPRMTAATYRKLQAGTSVAPGEFEPAKAKKNQPERDLQRACVEWLNMVKPRCVWLHPANELAATLSDGARMYFASLGMVSGAPDFVLLWARGCGAIELKSETGTQTKGQKAFAAWCSRNYVPYQVARTLDEFSAIVRQWGLLK